VVGFVSGFLLGKEGSKKGSDSRESNKLEETSVGYLFKFCEAKGGEEIL
jgi:hypothetical protein